MIYITKEDIIEVIQERLMNDSVALKEVEPNLDNNDILNGIEKKAIDLVISFISGKYDHEQIFADPPIRNGVLVQVIASIVVYRSVRRNAARKVPEDYIQLFKDAKKDLERIQSGVMNLIECPKLTNTDGTSTSPIYGNNTKDEFFI